jgi:cold-inducible RNA-binding protein
MSSKLYVGNLSPDTTGDELRTLFSEVGAVESCQLIMGSETGRSKGFGFIEMNSMEAADAAKENDAKPRTDYRNPAGYSDSRRT